LEADLRIKKMYFYDQVNEECNYFTFERDNGSGPVRIGTQLKPNQDIYSLMFASHFKMSIVDKNRWKAKLAAEAI
jgi:hypothetical protein